jgi:hypothetical protein
MPNDEITVREAMANHADTITAMVNAGAADTVATSVQMAVVNGHPGALRVLLAAVYIAGQLSVEDTRPDPTIWDIETGEV